MAFLGGLMSGTTGAFIRGSLDTATDLIQAKSVRDEEGIQERVKGFGAKKKVYDDGVNAFNSETQKIDSIAQLLAAQDDEMLQGSSEDELKSIARGLMQYDSKNPLDFFLKNRDKFTVKPIKTTTETPAQSPDMAQTDAALSAAETPTKPEGGFMANLGRMFDGLDETQKKQEVAKRLGVSVEAYDKIMAGRLPSRDPVTAQIAIGTADPYKDIIKSNNTAVLGAIKTGQPIYNTEKGAGLARLYLRAYANYGANADGAMNAEELLNLQSDILTQAAPPENQKFFATYDENLTSLNGIIHGDKIPKGVRDTALPLYKEIMQMKMKANDPAYGSDVKNATLYSDKIFELTKMLDISGNNDSFKTVSSMYERIVNNAIDKPSTFGADNLNMLFSLEPEIRAARESGDTTLLPSILDALTRVQLNRPKEEDSQTDYDKKRINVINFLMSEQGGSLSKSDAELAATQQIDLDKVFMDQQTPSIIVTIDGQKVLKPLPRMSALTGKIGAPGPKIESLNVDKINKNNTSMMSIGSAIVGLDKEPDAFNIIGDFYLKGTDVGDMLTSPAYMQANYPNFVESTVTIQKMRQDTIPLIATAKDRLFEDPRLSDQDLRLVLDYVAVINDKTIGGTRAMAALVNLQAAIAQDQAMRMYQNDPSRKLGTFVNGVLDIEDTNTIAGNIAQNLSSSQGFKLLSIEEHKKLSTGAKRKYKAQYNRVAAMTNRTMKRIQALRDLNGDTEAYRSTYAGQSSLANVGRASLKPDNFDGNISVGNLQQELDAGRKRVLAIDPAFYGES